MACVQAAQGADPSEVGIGRQFQAPRRPEPHRCCIRHGNAQALCRPTSRRLPACGSGGVTDGRGKSLSTGGCDPARPRGDRESRRRSFARRQLIALRVDAPVAKGRGVRVHLTASPPSWSARPSVIHCARTSPEPMRPAPKFSCQCGHAESRLARRRRKASCSLFLWPWRAA